jgi:hypothetical protein
MGSRYVFKVTYLITTPTSSVSYSIQDCTKYVIAYSFKEAADICLSLTDIISIIKLGEVFE